MNKPRLPPELYRPSRFGAAAFISYSVALFIVPAALSRFIRHGYFHDQKVHIEPGVLAACHGEVALSMRDAKR